MKLRGLFLLFFNLALWVSGQDSLMSRYSIYYPNGGKYTGNTRDFDRLNGEFEEKGRVWLYTQPRDKTAWPSVIAFKLFTSIPLWIYTVEDSSDIHGLIKSVSLEELMNLNNIESQLQKYIKKGTLSDIFILQTLGPPDSMVTLFDKNDKVNQWTYSKLHLYLIFTDRVVSNYIKMDDYR